MKLEKDMGAYGRWLIHEYISFRTNGSSAPDRIRDGKSGLCTGVTRVSAGLYTIAMRTDRPTVTRHVISQATVSAVANTAPTKNANAFYVDGSYSQSAGTFQVLVLDSAASAAAADPDSGARVNIHLVGSISSVGTDAA